MFQLKKGESPRGLPRGDSLASCQPEATALEIKQALFKSADKYQHLEAYAKDGRVLNILRAVENFCYTASESSRNLDKKKTVAEEKNVDL